MQSKHSKSVIFIYILKQKSKTSHLTYRWTGKHLLMRLPSALSRPALCTAESHCLKFFLSSCLSKLLQRPQIPPLLVSPSVVFDQSPRRDAVKLEGLASAPAGRRSVNTGPGPRKMFRGRRVTDTHGAVEVYLAALACEGWCCCWALDLRGQGPHSGGRLCVCSPSAVLFHPTCFVL